MKVFMYWMNGNTDIINIPRKREALIWENDKMAWKAIKELMLPFEPRRAHIRTPSVIMLSEISSDPYFLDGQHVEDIHTPLLNDFRTRILEGVSHATDDYLIKPLKWIAIGLGILFFVLISQRTGLFNPDNIKNMWQGGAALYSPAPNNPAPQITPTPRRQ